MLALQPESSSGTSDITLFSGPSNTFTLAGDTITVLVIQAIAFLGASGSMESFITLILAEGTVESGFAETFSVGIVTGGTVLAGAFEFAVGTEFALFALIQAELSAPAIGADAFALFITLSTVLAWAGFEAVGSPFIIRTLLFASLSAESTRTNAVAEFGVTASAVFAIAFFVAAETPGAG